MTFLVELAFWVEGLVIKYYKDHMNEKEVEDKK